jgi:hypothetical protein
MYCFIYTTGKSKRDEPEKKEEQIEVKNIEAYNDIARIEMSSKGYLDYIKKHGFHFTNSLVTEASKNMQNSDGTSHRWAPESFEATLNMYGLKAANINNCTIADMCYLANMAYADGFYEGLPDAEKWCLKYAIKVADDIDGYEGMPFMRWLSDTIGKNIKIDWTKYA